MHSRTECLSHTRPRADVPASDSSDFLQSFSAFLERSTPSVLRLERLSLTMENWYDKMLSVSGPLCKRVGRRRRAVRAILAAHGQGAGEQLGRGEAWRLRSPSRRMAASSQVTLRFIRVCVTVRRVYLLCNPHSAGFLLVHYLRKALSAAQPASVQHLLTIPLVCVLCLSKAGLSFM